MKILFLSTWYPDPPDNGSKLRIYHLLRGLAAEHEISLISFSSEPERVAHTTSALEYCQEVQIVPLKEFDPASPKARLGFLSLEPRSMVDTYSPAMEAAIAKALASQNYDLAIASEVRSARYGYCLAGIPAIFEDVEIGVLYEQYAHAPTLLRRLRYGFTWAKHLRYLQRLMQHYRACTVVSERERDLLAPALPDHTSVVVVPNGVDLPSYTNFHTQPQEQTLIFTGAFTFNPNYTAMDWFTREVFPSLRTRYPNLSLTITGNPDGHFFNPSEGIIQTGYVPDVRPLIANSWISLAPIWSGSGTRIKILEAMALRTPVVATSKGAEGLEAVDGVHLLLADTPEEFSAAIDRLLKDRSLRERLADNAYQLVARQFAWDTILPPFFELAQRIAEH